MSYANSGPPLAGGCGPRSSANCIIHVRQPFPRQERFRIKGGRSDEAFKSENVFDKPSAEPNLFELCRGEKTSAKRTFDPQKCEASDLA